MSKSPQPFGRARWKALQRWDELKKQGKFKRREELAEAAKVGLSTVARFFRGEEVMAKVALDICKQLGAETEYAELMRVTGALETPPETEA